MPISYHGQHNSIEQNQAIVESLSDQQLMQAYSDASIPQFIVFTEMQKRQRMEKAKAQSPQMTVAERMIGRPPEAEGIASVEAPPEEMAKGGITRASPLSMGYSEDLPAGVRREIAMRLQQMKDLEEPDYNPEHAVTAATGGEIRLAGSSDGETVSEELPPVTRKDFSKKSAVSPEYIFNTLVSKYQYPKHVAAAIAGNIHHESRSDPRSVQENVKTNPGRGLVQWDKDRFGNMIKFSNERRLDPYDVDTQLAFIDNELRVSEAGSGKKLFASTDLKGANDAFLGYLRPKNYSPKDPSSTIHYANRYNNAAGLFNLSTVPNREKAEGADTYIPSEYDPSTGIGGIKQSTQYADVPDRRYQYIRSPDKTPVDKGLDALRAAKALQGIRFAEGGAVYLSDGNDGKTIKDREAQNNIRRFAQIQRAITGRDEPIYNINPPDSQDYPISDEESERLSREYETSIPGLSRVKPESRTLQLDRAIDQSRFPQTQIGYLDTETNQGYNPPPQEPQYPANVDDQATGTGMERFVSPSQMEGRGDIGIRGLFPPSPFPQWKRDGVTLPKRGEVQPPEAEGIASGIPVGMGPQIKGGPGSGKGIPSADPRSGGAGAPGGAGGPGSAGGAGAPGGAGEDQSFSQVLKQVKDAIGSSVPDEMKEQMKQHQETLSKMRNDKVVDTMFAAAKTLAGQRKGSVNFADAVANAGLAAQEAQKRIYKAEDDMRKYRMEAIKLEQEGNKTAATQAMNYVIQANHDKRALQTAMMQTSKMIQAQDASDRRANIAASTKELVAAESKLADLNRMILNPQAFGITDTKALEIERDRLNQQINGARAGLNYWQTGVSYDAVREEAKKRGLIP